MLTVRANGADIPALGFGTAGLRGADCERAVDAALADGYRHIDTAQGYGNEREVGRAIRASTVPRDELFLTTKVARAAMRDGDLQRSVEESLARLGLTHVDLLLLHWPVPDVPLRETVAALCEVRERGMARHIGVSNFTVELLDRAVAHADAPLVANQVEYHPFLDQSAVLAACRRHGLALTAYAPLAQGQVFADATLRTIAERHGRSPGQIAIRWLIQQPGVTAIPRSSSREHIHDNLGAFDFALGPGEMEAIARLARVNGRIISPAWAPHWDASA